METSRKGLKIQNIPSITESFWYCIEVFGEGYFYFDQTTGQNNFTQFLNLSDKNGNLDIIKRRAYNCLQDYKKREIRIVKIKTTVETIKHSQYSQYDFKMVQKDIAESYEILNWEENIHKKSDQFYNQEDLVQLLRSI